MKRILLLFAIICPLTAHASGICEVPTPCQPTDTITVTSDSLNTAQVSLSKLSLIPLVGAAGRFETPVTINTTNPKEFSFQIPAEAPDGTYQLKIKQTAKQKSPEAEATNGPIDDLSFDEIIVKSPTITRVVPTAAFWDDNRLSIVTVLGSGFRKDADLELFGLGRIARCKADDKERTNCYDLTVVDGREITLAFYELRPKEYYDGAQEFAICVEGVSTNTAKLTLIDIGANTPMTWALVSVVAIVVVVFLLLRAGKQIVTQKFGGKEYWKSALFLDEQTSSYSLSKCQFYAWTAAAVLGYIFLAVSRSHVQGSATFPDIPSGLPGILLASAGTAVLATGITSAKGSKGAGGPQPNFSDFICTGGVVAADRLQFAVWTIVGLGTFLAIVFKSDPRTINDLPAIPSGFLQLMGISAGGYIAGKLARKAGPTIDSITISGSPDKVTFQLTGSGLSRSALFSIDDKPIFPDTIQGKDPNSKLPDVVQLDPTAGDPDLARILNFTVTQPQETWLGGTTPKSFTITNPDKQKAMLPFQIFKVTAVSINGIAGDLTITGEFLDKNLKVAYTPAGGGTTIDVTSSACATGGPYTAKVQANLSGQVKVTITDTSGFAVDRNVTVT